jgi:hypothetical protein
MGAGIGGSIKFRVKNKVTEVPATGEINQDEVGKMKAELRAVMNKYKQRRAKKKAKAKKPAGGGR